MKGPKLAAFLAVAAIAVAIQNYLYFSSVPDGLPVPNPQVAGESEDGRADASADELVPVEAAALASWFQEQRDRGRNPFLMRSEEVGFLGGSVDPGVTFLPRLSGTLWSRGRRVAWLDGRPVGEGDWIGDYRLASIQPSKVVLERDGYPVPLSIDSATGPWPPEELQDGN